MNCEKCNHKMVLISHEYGLLIYCPICMPSGDHLFVDAMKPKRNDNKLEEALGHKPKEEVK